MEIYKETNTAASKEFEKLLDNQISKTKNLKSKNPNLTSLETSIEDKTGIKVFIKNKKNNAGSVTFEYKDLDQLNRLIMVIKANY